MLNINVKQLCCAADRCINTAPLEVFVWVAFISQLVQLFVSTLLTILMLQIKYHNSHENDFRKSIEAVNNYLR